MNGVMSLVATRHGKICYEVIQSGRERMRPASGTTISVP